MIKLAIVDLDGTLAYTIPGMMMGINAVRRKIGCEDITEKKILECISNATPGFVGHLIEDTPLKDNLDEAIRMYLEEYSKCCVEGSTPYEGIREEMQKMRDVGISLVVFSNKDNIRVNWIMEKYFSGIFNECIGTGIYPFKPDPTVPLDIASRYGAKPDETVFIGDSDVDVMTAKNAGMISLNVAWGYVDRDILKKAGSQYMAEKPQDLMKIINEINIAQEKGV